MVSYLSQREVIACAGYLGPCVSLSINLKHGRQCNNIFSVHFKSVLQYFCHPVCSMLLVNCVHWVKQLFSFCSWVLHSRHSSSSSLLLLTSFFSTARRKWGDEGRIKSGTFFSWLILRQLLCPSQCYGVIDADRGVGLLPGPRGCTVWWAQETLHSKHCPWIQTAFEFLALMCKLHG